MKNNFEVEIRGPISRDEYNTLDSFLSENATFKEKRERIFIDYSTELENRTKDIRIRETNGVPEIILKLGSWGGSESREEISVKAEPGKFEDLVKTFGELGFTKGVLCIRNSVVYDYKGIEFALVEVPNHSYYFEAEILTEPQKSVEAESEIRKVCEELKLRVFSRDDFFKYVEILNKEANKIFDYKDYQKRVFW